MNNILKLFSLAAATVLAISGCQEWPDESGDDLFNISGIVSDKTTNASIPAVNVTLRPAGINLVTGEDGVYRFSGLTSGKYTLDFVKEGYLSSSIDIEVHESVNHDASLERIPAVLISDKTVLDFGDQITSLSFSIVNRGYWDLEWEIPDEWRQSSWIQSVYPDKGILKYGKTETIIVSIDRTELESGNNETVLNVRSTGEGGTEIRITAYNQPERMAAAEIFEVSEITASTAMLSGKITDEGHPIYQECGFIVGTDAILSIETAEQTLKATPSSDGKYNCTISGLTLGKTYYARGFISNAKGTFYSNTVSFKTVSTPPSVKITEVTALNLASMTAVFNGTIEFVGDPEYYERGFVYSCTNVTPSLFDSKIIADGNGSGTYSSLVENLIAEQFYFVRAYAKSDGGVCYSTSALRFSTALSYPSVSTGRITEIDAQNRSARVYGEILDVGMPAYTEKGFVYSSEKSAPTVSDSKVAVSGNGAGAYSIVLDELYNNTTYYIRAFAENKKGIVYGETQTLEF